MKRLLCIVGSLNQGGAETFLMKMLRNIDKTKYLIDFCVMSDEKGVYEPEVKKLGGRVFHTVPKSKNPTECFNDIKKIVSENSYKSVMRVNEHSLSVIDLIAAKLGGADRLIMRSSNANSASDLTRALHYAFRFLPKYVPNVKFAPSTEAAVYTFGKKQVKAGKVQKLNNGINIKEYLFDEEKRKKKRSELGLTDEFAIVHIGRFMEQKNHRFLIEVFCKLKERNDKARLFLIGAKNMLYDEVQRSVAEKGLNDSVIFLGSRADVPDLLSAMDMLLFPSLYEGMPNVVIEAQAAGLPCVISDTITREADITGLVRYLPLKNGAEAWAECCVETLKEKKKRPDTEDCFKENKYDIESVTDEFVRLVF